MNIQNARLGMNITPGTLSIRQPGPTIEMKTTPPTMQITSPKGDLRIDQSKAWDALGFSRNDTLLQRIGSEAKRIALEGIRKTMEKGHRMAQIQNHGNPIAEIAAEEAFQRSDMNYVGEASYSNVDIEYTAHLPVIDVTPGSVEYNAVPNPPEISYEPGKVSYYMIQYPKVEMIPPQIDIRA